MDGNKFENVTGGDAFDDADNLTARVFRKETTEQMDMILVETDRVDVKRVAFLKTAQCHKHDLLDILIQQRFPILYGNLDVIVTLRDIAVPMPNAVVSFDVGAGHTRPLYYVLGHSSLLGAQGFWPEEI